MTISQLYGRDVNGNMVPVLVAADGTIASASSATAVTPLTPASTTALASSLVLKASAGSFYGLQVTNGATAGFVMLFNAATAPADGAVTPTKVYAMAANSSLSVSVGGGPPTAFSTGVTVVYSSTGPFTKTASATAFISGEAV